MQWVGGAAGKRHVPSIRVRVVRQFYNGVPRSLAMQMLFVVGLSIGWTSPYLAQFASENPPFSATVDEITWMASIYHLGRLPGGILGAICIQRFGSKTAMICNGCALLISWILVILATSPSWIYVARIIFGASIEIASLSYPLYLGDISSPKIRGALITMAGNGLVVGLLVGNAMGPHISMKLYASISLVPNICFILVLLFCTPHSPYYLVSKGRMKDAERSMVRYNPRVDVIAEIQNVKIFVDNARAITLIDRLREFMIPRNRKIGIIVAMLCMFSEFSGVDAISSYMQTILTRGLVTAISPSTVPVIANALGFVAGSVTMYLTEKLGRRIMWIVSSAGVCGTMIVLGTHFYLLGEGFDAATLQWLAIFSMISFKVFYNMGLGCVSLILVGELFPSNIKTLAACVASISTASFAFVTIYVYQFLIQIINEAYVYWMFSSIMLVSVVLGVYLVPEMKGKTLLEIQDMLDKDKHTST